MYQASAVLELMAGTFLPIYCNIRILLLHLLPKVLGNNS